MPGVNACVNTCLSRCARNSGHTTGYGRTRRDDGGARRAVQRSTRGALGRVCASEEEAEASSRAWVRAKHALRRRRSEQDEDVYAEALLGAAMEGDGVDGDDDDATTSTSHATHALDVLAFKRLSAMMNTYENNVETYGIARQIVVITAGGDTRAFRLPFPIGTAIFECADAEVHTKVAATLKAVGAKPSRGCSHRRIPVDITREDVNYGDLEDRLERSGYQPDVRSIWIVQDVHAWSHARLSSFLAESADLMTIGSDIILDASGMACTDDIARREFAANGVLAESIRIPPDDGREPIRLFLGFKQRVSAKEVQYYREQIIAAEDEADEDGFED
jgi:methyltransferase (TIGR00027 family)